MTENPLYIAAAVAAGLAAVAAAYFLYTKMRNDVAPRTRRLAYIEHAYLEGGRKLLLVRRDDVEHLILIGGPIDLVVESGIRVEAASRREAAEDVFAGAVQSYAETARSWQKSSLAMPKGRGSGAEQGLRLAQDEPAADDDDGSASTLELTPMHEAKTGTR